MAESKRENFNDLELPDESILPSESKRENFNDLELSEQICLLGNFLKHKDLPHDKHTNLPHDDLLPQLKEWVDILMHATECQNKLCPYPNCSKGKELCHHVLITCSRERWCELCFSTMLIVKFHAGDCSDFDCTLLGCCEYQADQIWRRRKNKRCLRRQKARLSRLRNREVGLRSFYDRQMFESLRASVAAVLRLSAKGKESKRNDVKRLLGSIFYVFRCCYRSSKSWSQQKKLKEKN